MPELYIANCTRQQQVACYRLDFIEPGKTGIFKPGIQRQIAPGQQVQIKVDTIDQIQSIAEQLGRYGMVAMEDVHRTEAFVPLIFNTGLPVKVAAIRATMEQNAGFRTHEGQLRRTRAAVASNETVVKAVAAELARRELPPEAVPDTVETAVEFEQLDTTEDAQTRLEQGVLVRSDAPPQSTPGRRKPGPKPGSKRIKRSR